VPDVGTFEAWLNVVPACGDEADAASRWLAIQKHMWLPFVGDEQMKRLRRSL
jgi:hypothetical protein